MNDTFDSNDGPSRRRGDANEAHGSTGSEPGITHWEARSRPAGVASAPRIDFWTVADALAHRWHWLVIGGILGCGALFALGGSYIPQKFTAVVQLLRYETPAESESLKTAPLSPETFGGLIRSPDLLRQVGNKVQPPIPPERFLKILKIDPQPDSDIVKVYLVASDPSRAVDLANLYAHDAVEYTKELQARQSAQIAQNYLRKQVTDMDQDIGLLRDKLRGRSVPAPISNALEQVSSDLNALDRQLSVPPRTSALTMKLSEQLQTRLTELSTLTATFTDIHPDVIRKRAEIEALKKEISDVSTNANFASGSLGRALNAGPGSTSIDPDYDIIRTKLSALEDARVQLANRQREAQMYADNPPGVVRVFAPATMRTVQSGHRRIKIGLATVAGGFVGIGCSLMLLLVVELFDKRLRTVEDVKRVTKLPVLTTLGDLNRMRNGSREQWAFRAWTMLQGRLSRSANHGLVCGITSSTQGEGRSTWIHLLAEAASLTGFRVLTIATQPSPSHVHSAGQIDEETLEHPAELPDSQTQTPNHSAALTSNVLTSPGQVTDRLTAPNSRPMVHIPLPGWVWNLERRKQWREALNQWRKIDNLVILVELPPASVPEAVLLGSNLPNLLWLTDSQTADASETRTQLETLWNARCNLVGAVLNRETARPVKSRFTRWLPAFAVLAMLGGSLHAQETNTPPPVTLPIAPESGSEASTAAADTNLSFSIVSPAQRAPWQERLVLGPGDVLGFALYGEPTVTRPEVVIAPDGRVSFLEAHDVLATGLTVDELRSKFDEELGKYRRAAHTIITPVAYKSKRYYMLGKVVQKGVYILDRPITVIEALARARGFENGLVEDNTVDLADLPRSFLMRNGKRMPVDFEKLIQAGDLGQNVQIEPGDYLFFPSASLQQVYVLGEVALPGLVTYRPDMTVMAALSSRGGFNEKAYKTHVLVVRGSLNHPETFVVDTMAITSGRHPDFRLQPKDIVYVSHRPWYRAEDLLDLATTAFTQAAVSSWAGRDVLSPIK